MSNNDLHLRCPSTIIFYKDHQKCQKRDEPSSRLNFAVSYGQAEAKAEAEAEAEAEAGQAEAGVGTDTSGAGKHSREPWPSDTQAKGHARNIIAQHAPVVRVLSHSNPSWTSTQIEHTSLQMLKQELLEIATQWMDVAQGLQAEFTKSSSVLSTTKATLVSLRTECAALKASKVDLLTRQSALMEDKRAGDKETKAHLVRN
jgi:hypothetical protein